MPKSKKQEEKLQRKAQQKMQVEREGTEQQQDHRPGPRDWQGRPFDRSE